MEMLSKIETFLSTGKSRGSGYGRGRGNGSGFGDGRGSGYGYGNGSGYGCGYGFGSGFGDGRGSGSGIKSINGHSVFFIDGIPTAITAVTGNVAKGYVVDDDFTLIPCYIAKSGNSFAHGNTLEKAVADARAKELSEKPEEERIQDFIAEHDYNKTYAVSDLYKWHNILTGSCEMGRKQFAKEHNIDIEQDKMTVKHFIEITKESYCGSVIKNLEKAYKKGQAEQS